MSFRRTLGAVVLLPLLVAGCALLPRVEPVPPPLSREEVIAALSTRSEQFRTVVDDRVSLRVEEHTAEGWKKWPSLGGVLAFDRLRPGLWFRAEKLGQRVFDLRAGRDSFWLELPDTREVVTGSTQAFRKVPQLIHPYEVLLWFGAPQWLGLTWKGTTMTLDPEHYRFEVISGGLPLRRVLVDRRRLVVSAIVTYDLIGAPSTEVRMDDYKRVGRWSFPHRLTVTRFEQGYRLRLKLGSPEFNEAIPRTFFEPKERRGWSRVDLDVEPLSSVRAFNPDQ